MTCGLRLLLIGLAMIGTAVTAIGASLFGAGVDPSGRDGSHVAIGIVGGVVSTAPLWIPALIPSRLRSALVLACVGSAVVLAFPALLLAIVLLGGFLEKAYGTGYLQGQLLPVVIVFGFLTILTSLLGRLLAGHGRER